MNFLNVSYVCETLLKMHLPKSDAFSRGMFPDMCWFPEVKNMEKFIDDSVANKRCLKTENIFLWSSFHIYERYIVVWGLIRNAAW